MTNEKDKKKLEKELKDLKAKFESQEEEYNKILTSKDEKIAKIEKSLEEEKQKKEEYVSHSQRLQADFENFKKQTEKRNKEIIKYANEQVIVDFLDVYEDLKRALENSKNEKELKDGVKLIYSKLQTQLTKEGLEEIPTKEEKFDPFKHEALLSEKSDDHENNEIIEELMKGYTLKDKVIKYSKVKVCKK